MSKIHWGWWVFFVLAFITLFGMMVSPTIETESTTQVALTSTRPAESKAMAYAHTVHATLDRTEFGDFMMMMPNNIQPESQWDGASDSNRTFTWTFSDGSTIVAVFKPSSIQGGGLILYSIKIPAR